jgi:hypothetical protein
MSSRNSAAYGEWKPLKLKEKERRSDELMSVSESEDELAIEQMSFAHPYSNPN